MLPKRSFCDQEQKTGCPDAGLNAEAARRFREHGALQFENAFPQQLIEEVAASFAETYQSISKKELRKRDAVVGDRRYMITINIKKPFNNPLLFANPLLMPILEDLLSVHLRIASFGAVVAWPGAESQPIHLDHPPLFEPDRQREPLPPWAATLVIPLIDVTEDVGPTAIWPGTHRSADRGERLRELMEQPDFSDAAKPETRLGDAWLMDYRVIHGGMANNSDQVRPILYLVYGRPWFRDGFNFSSQPAVQISDKQRQKIPRRWKGLFHG